MEIDPSGHYEAVVTGHWHRPSVERRNGILFLNPGSAGPRRFKLPISVARLTVRGGDMKVKLVELRNEI
jgi:predicted phosphodiesterase